ncbi:MAG: hypothetical protein ACRC63_02035, partial [Metamycoplasmataceae bacterium]
MNNIEIEEIWNKFEEKFNIDKILDYLTLASLLKLIIEKEHLKKIIGKQDYSTLNDFRHLERNNFKLHDLPGFLNSISNILELLPQKYHCDNIKNQISLYIAKEESDVLEIFEIWNQFEKTFQINEIINFFTLSWLLKLIIKKEEIDTIDDVHFSVIHKFLHWESILSDNKVMLISIINILVKFPEKYNYDNIKNQIIFHIPKEEDFFEINMSKNREVRKKYELLIKNFSIFTFNEIIYIYTGQIINNKNERIITFISKNKLILKNTYEFKFEYVTINYDTEIFMEIENKNLSNINRKKICDDRKDVKNYNDLLLLLNSEIWPFDKALMKKRDILK